MNRLIKGARKRTNILEFPDQQASVAPNQVDIQLPSYKRPRLGSTSSVPQMPKTTCPSELSSTATSRPIQIPDKQILDRVPRPQVKSYYLV